MSTNTEIFEDGTFRVVEAIEYNSYSLLNVIKYRIFIDDLYFGTVYSWIGKLDKFMNMHILKEITPLNRCNLSILN